MIIEVTSVNPQISKQQSIGFAEGAVETIIKSKGQTRIRVRISDEYSYLIDFHENGNVHFTSTGKVPTMSVPQNLYLSQE